MQDEACGEGEGHWSARGVASLLALPGQERKDTRLGGEEWKRMGKGMISKGDSHHRRPVQDYPDHDNGGNHHHQDHSRHP